MALAQAVTDSFRNLYETKHLYQSVEVPLERILGEVSEEEASVRGPVGPGGNAEIVRDAYRTTVLFVGRLRPWVCNEGAPQPPV
jgi:hypothetical protein